MRSLRTLQSRQRAILIRTGKLREADDLGGQDCSELAGSATPPSRAARVSQDQAQIVLIDAGTSQAASE